MSVVVQTDTKESTAQVKANIVAFSKADKDLQLELTNSRKTELLIARFSHIRTQPSNVQNSTLFLASKLLLAAASFAHHVLDSKNMLSLCDQSLLKQKEMFSCPWKFFPLNKETVTIDIQLKIVDLCLNLHFSFPLTERSPCQPDTCENGGTCFETESGFKCLCRAGYSGKTCSGNT